jgi:hypothetical protein
MSFSIMNDYDIKSQKLARELYNAAMDGTITFTQAWYGLPGPAPIVGSTKIANWVTYNVDYKYLTKEEASYLKQKEEEEYKEKCLKRDQTLAIEKRKDILYEEEMMNRFKSASDLNEGLEEYLKKEKEHIDDLRNELQKHEEAYARTEQVYLNTKKEKEELENTIKSHTNYSVVRYMDLLDRVYTDIREHNHRMTECMKRQKQEEILYEKLKQMN